MALTRLLPRPNSRARPDLRRIKLADLFMKLVPQHAPAYRSIRNQPLDGVQNPRFTKQLIRLIRRERQRFVAAISLQRDKGQNGNQDETRNSSRVPRGSCAAGPFVAEIRAVCAACIRFPRRIRGALDHAATLVRQCVHNSTLCFVYSASEAEGTTSKAPLIEQR